MKTEKKKEDRAGEDQKSAQGAAAGKGRPEREQQSNEGRRRKCILGNQLVLSITLYKALRMEVS